MYFARFSFVHIGGPSSNQATFLEITIDSYDSTSFKTDTKTKLSELYAIPKEGIGVRGGDIDKNGVLWGSGSNGTSNASSSSEK